MTYDAAKIYNKLRPSDARKDDDSSSKEHESFNENGQSRKADTRNPEMRVPEENARDDSMLHEEEVQLAKNYYENSYGRNGEARGLHSKENDDGSLVKHQRVSFQKLPQRNQVGNDDSSLGKYGSSADLHGKDHETADDVLKDEAFVAKSKSNDDSVASEEKNVAGMGSKFSGPGNDVNKRRDDRVDVLSKRAHPHLSCTYCCRFIR